MSELSSSQRNVVGKRRPMDDESITETRGAHLGAKKKRSTTTTNSSVPSPTPPLPSDLAETNRSSLSPSLSSLDLPLSSAHYHVSWMHAAVVTCVAVSIKHGYVVTADANGTVKFWKRLPTAPTTTGGVTTTPDPQHKHQQHHPCLEFVKSFTAHASAVVHLSVDNYTDTNNHNNNSNMGTWGGGGDWCVSVSLHSATGTTTNTSARLQFYDVATFDAAARVTLPIPNPTTTTTGNSSGSSNTTDSSVPISGGMCAWFVSAATGQSCVAVAIHHLIYIVSPIATDSNLLDHDDDDDDDKNHNHTTTTTTGSTVPNSPYMAVIALHAAPVTCLAYVPHRHCVLSCDAAGCMDVWDVAGVVPGGPCCGTTTTSSLETTTNHGVRYQSKLETDFYALVRTGTFAVAVATTTIQSASPLQQSQPQQSSSSLSSYYAIYAADHTLRVFAHATGQVVVLWEERPTVYDTMYDQPPFFLDSMEYGKRAATEREINQETAIFRAGLVTNANRHAHDKAMPPLPPQRVSIQFDGTGRYLLVPSMMGIKVLDWRSNKRRRLVGCIGTADAGNLRLISVALAAGNAVVNAQLQLALGTLAANSSDIQDSAVTTKRISDTVVIALAYNQRRFYVYSHIDPVRMAEEASGTKTGNSTAANEALTRRDVWNEAPSASDQLYAPALNATSTELSATNVTKAILRTTMGDVHLSLFGAQVPRTVENFVGHAQSGYYDNCIFHRVIAGFMLQTGDPLGDGTGGESIWGGEFEDEIVLPTLRHDRPFTVSMANAGKNTNGSQFFITTVATPWLDGKHTVFGRVVKGMDICSLIEKVKTDESDKPLDEIRIHNIDLE